jgi:hypothetical protein
MKPRQRSEGCSLSQPAITKATGQVLLTKASASYSIVLYISFKAIRERGSKQSGPSPHMLCPGGGNLRNTISFCLIADHL